MSDLVDTSASDASGSDTPATPAVEVTSNRLNPRPIYGLTPLQAGLLYGGAAATVMGPLGALVGLGVGIANKLSRDNLLDLRARQVNDVVSNTQALHNQAQDMMQGADPDTQKFLQEQMRLASEGMAQFINEGDPAGRAKMENANTALAGVLSANMAQRRDNANQMASAQRSLVTSSAETYRNQFQTNQDNFRTVNTQADKILDLTNAADFDPNKSVNKGLIVGMLTTGIGMYRDNPADYTDAVTQGVSGLSGLPGPAGAAGGVVSGVVGGIMTAIKSKEFQLSKDDYIRLAMNMKNYAAKDAQAKSQQLGAQAQNLDAQARKWGVFDEKTNLHDYITGGVNELPITPVPNLPPAPTPSQLYPSATPVPSNARSGVINRQGSLQWLMDQQRRNPTNNLAEGLTQARPTN